MNLLEAIVLKAKQQKKCIILPKKNSERDAKGKVSNVEYNIVVKTIKAVEVVKQIKFDLSINVEPKANAALINHIGHKKIPDFSISRHNNVLVFLGLQNKNIGYKRIKCFGLAQAVRLILQELIAPINVLSIGYLVERYCLFNCYNC